MRLAIVLLLIGSPAWAKPKVCAPIAAAPRWVIAKSQAFACFTEDAARETCFAVSPTHGPRRADAPADERRPLPALAEVRDIGGVPHACIATHCTELGPNLRAALAADAANAKLTIDGRTVALTGTRAAWDVRRDREIDLRPPPLEASVGDQPMTLDVVDGVMLAEWEPCAGPCAVQTLVDSSGHNIGRPFGAGEPVVIDDHRVAIVPENGGAFLVLDVAKARILSRLSLRGEIDQRSGALYDRTTVVVASEEGAADAWVVQFIAVPRHAKAEVAATYKLPFCRD